MKRWTSKLYLGTRNMNFSVNHFSTVDIYVHETIIKNSHLPGGHSAGDKSLEGKLLLLEIIRSGILDLKLGHGVAESRLNLLLVATLQLDRHGGVGDDLLNAGDVRLKLLARFEPLGELLVARLELGSIFGNVSQGSSFDPGSVCCLPLIIWSISVLESLPTAFEMVMLAVRPEDFSVAVTFRIPLTSTSKTHSRAASPAFMGGIGAKVNSPRDVLSEQLVRSPWKTGN